MEKLIIRNANIEDLKNIQELNKVLFALEYNNFDKSLDASWPVSKEGEEYFKEAIRNDIVLVAVFDGQIIGYLIGSLNTQYSYNTTIQAELDNMCILEKYRKMGIGKKLFSKFKEICLDNQINEIKVVASYNNITAINFYKKNGFEEAELTLKQKI